MAADPKFDKLFDCRANGEAGYLTIEFEIDGRPLNWSVTGEITIEFEITGEANAGGLVRLTDDGAIVVAFELTGEALIETARTNWVGWSKIGDITFRQDLTNDSGYRPMSWKGWVYQVLPLGKNVVVYGSGGISLLFPVTDPAPTFGCKDLFSFGIQNKNAACGDRDTHYFIDAIGNLWMLTAEVRHNLGYKEFLSELTKPTMIYDSVQKRVFISDATKGYIFTPQGLGGGYPALTGFDRVQGTPVVGSPGNGLSTPVISLLTDTLDFGYSGMKSVAAIQVSAEHQEKLYVAVDFRYDRTESWRTSRWIRLNKEGVAFLNVAGIEFRVRVKNLAPDELKIDYINIQYKRIDKRFVRGPIGLYMNKGGASDDYNASAESDS